MYVMNSTGVFVLLVFLSAILVILFVLYKCYIQKIFEIERTRSRIARDLHDEIGSSLSGVALMIDMISNKKSIVEKDKAELLSVSSVIRDMVDSLRNVVWVINPERDKLESMVEWMKSIARTMLQNIYYKIDVYVMDPNKIMSMESKRAILLLYKEALNNVVQHSGATIVAIHIEENAGHFRLIVEDNGVGFNQAQLSYGDGLKNMRYRAQQMRGILTVESKPGNGTKLEFQMNLIQKRSLTIYEGDNDRTQIGYDQHLAGG
jgi:signal transduction histidine kinase